jgi:hypothetical protein
MSRRTAVAWRSALLLAIACAPAADTEARDAGPAEFTRTDLRDVSVTGRFGNGDVVESSSAVASRLHAGVFWTHNDAGNDERLFAFDSAGQDLGSVRITGAKNRDWEAMTSGPCAEGTCLYIGDVGDNLAQQKFVRVYRVAEPAPPGRGRTERVRAAATLRFRYPDRAHDVEAMWMAPDTSLWFATKRRLRGADGANRPSLVFTVPASAWRDSGIVMATLADSLPIVPDGGEATMSSPSLVPAHRAACWPPARSRRSMSVRVRGSPGFPTDACCSRRRNRAPRSSRHAADEYGRGASPLIRVAARRA